MPILEIVAEDTQERSMGLKDKVDIGAKLDPLSVGIVRRCLSSYSGITVQSLNTNTITCT